MEVIASYPRHGTTFYELGTIMACLDNFTHFKPDAPFAGRPTDRAVRFGHDVRLSLMTTASKKYDTHAKRVLYAASFLEGAALAWFHGLLKQNVRALWTRRDDPAEPMPYYWSSWPFVIPELRTLDAFLKALQVEFPEQEVVDER